MTSSIPDGISANDLQAFAENAAPDITDVVKEVGPFAGKTKDQVEAIVDKIVDDMHAECNHPMIAKAVMMRLIDALLGWHSHQGAEFTEEGDVRQAMGWLRDAGKFQALANILDTVSVCKEDYLCGWSHAP